ncbi:MAG: hypothetical protein JWP28_2821, partial [Phenylobacterium sp.]|nr:hypothetical protein [Phenylobacterium sp.]
MTAPQQPTFSRSATSGHWETT